MADTGIEQAGGGIVWRSGDSGLEVLVVHRPRYDDWAYPKGKLDEGESLIECALREVFEETGLICRVGRYLGEISFTLPEGRDKTVSYWAMQAVEGTFEANDEVDAVQWVSEDELASELTYDLDRSLAEGLESDWKAAPDRIILTRHADAGDRFAWHTEDSLRPLSDRGATEAGLIAGQLSPFSIGRILSSRAVRCTETVAPLAALLQMAVETEPALWEESEFQEVVNLLDRSHRGTTVLCTHGPIIATAIHALTGASVGIPMEKASSWILDFSGPILTAANYLAPPKQENPPQSNTPTE